MNRGFTLVELIIVIAVITILSTIGVVSFTVVRNQASDSDAESMASTLMSALNSYYSKNNEYPLATDLYGGTTSGVPPSSYSAAATLLNVNQTVFSTSSNKFLPCSAAGTSSTSCSYGTSSAISDKDKVKYITKVSGQTSAISYYVYSPNGPGTAIEQCALVFGNAIDPSAVYVMTYFSREENKVKFIKSSRGDVTMSTPRSGQCVFTTP